MSFTDTRQELAFRLSTVAGLTGYEFRPAAPQLGDAWPLLNTADRGPGKAFSATWRVLVCLGGDEKKATRTSDDVLPDLVDALDPVAFVDQVSPVLLTTEGGSLFALELSCTSE